MDQWVKFIDIKGKKDLSGYTLIEGFPGVGLVGTIAAKYLVERLDFKEYAYLDSNVFSPIIRIHKGLPIHPSRIYVNDKKKLLVLISEQIVPKEYTNLMASSIVDWVKKKKIKDLISLSGIHTDEVSKSSIYGIATSDKTSKMLKKHDIEVIEDGVTTGVTALILLSLKEEPIHACSILGNVKIAADYKAAAEVIKKLNDILGLKINIQPLLKEAKETEKELLAHFERMNKTAKEVDSVERHPQMYT